MANLSDEIGRSYYSMKKKPSFALEIFFKKSYSRACIYEKNIVTLHVISGIRAFRND